MKLLISGSRKKEERKLVDNILLKYRREYEDLVILVGDAMGIDAMVQMGCFSLDISFRVFIPLWEVYGKGAGIVRNKQMVEQCDEGIAIWDGVSRGTKNTIDLLYKAKKLKKVYLV